MNLLICGGYNWLSYEIIKKYINQVNKIIIIDKFDFLNSDNASIFENNIQCKIEEYKHLFNDIIFIYNLNLKDKYKLDEIFNYHKINMVINNIKYNYNKNYKENEENLLCSHENIIQCIKKYDIQNYISINRTYSHNNIHLSNNNTNLKENTNLTYLNIFNMQKILNNDIVYNINYTDYLKGIHITNNTNIIFKYNYLNKIKSTVCNLNEKCFLSRSDELLYIINNLINNILITNLSTMQNKSLFFSNNIILKSKEIKYKELIDTT